MREERAEKVALAGIGAEPRGCRAQLAADVGREACNGRDARHSEQAGRKRGIGEFIGSITLVLGAFMGLLPAITMAERLTTPSSATGAAGAARAWWAERRRRKHGP